MRPVGEMDDDVGADEVFGPVRLGGDLPDRTQLDAEYRFCQARVRPRTRWPRSTSPPHNARPEVPHRSPQPAPPPAPPDLRERSCSKCIREAAVPSKADPTPVATPIRSGPPSRRYFPAPLPRAAKLLFLVTRTGISARIACRSPGRRATPVSRWWSRPECGSMASRSATRALRYVRLPGGGAATGSSARRGRLPPSPGSIAPSVPTSSITWH